MNPHGRKLTQGELSDLLPGITGIIAGLEPLNREVLEKSQLKVISRVGVGVNNVDLEAAKDLGIRVYYTPEGPTKAVSELTVGMMITLCRRVPEMDRALHEGQWAKQIGLQLENRRVLIIGAGRIGCMVIAMLRPFGPEIMIADPHVKAPPAGVEVVPLPEALPQADVISMHASGEQEILGEEEFQLMKPGVFLLNPGRGGLISETALCQALEGGKVAGAWIDTFSQEPYRGPLCRFPQVLLTPHIGTYSSQCRQSMEMGAVENLLLGMAGKPGGTLVP
jgi:D-3-phosphoglycerate dehydrogenase